MPDTLSEYAFAGLLRGEKTRVVKCLGSNLQVPASAEFILEGYLYPDEMADEGPFGDHTGYYNEVDRFPVFTVARITHRRDPIYHSTYTGRPPDEPAILGVALNEVFVPILKKQFPEIVDFYLPPEGCSYRMAVVTMKKQYPGHAKRVMMGVWSFLRQFMYTKFVVVTDDDVNARDWQDVIWAMTTRMDPRRDTVIIDNTPIYNVDLEDGVLGKADRNGSILISKDIKDPKQINPVEIIRLHREKNNKQNHKGLDKFLFLLFDDALKKIITDRQREGKKIKQLITSRSLRIEKEVAKIRKMIPRFIDIHQSKIVKKFKDALIDVDQDLSLIHI